jgi:hypothetical protein
MSVPDPSPQQSQLTAQNNIRRQLTESYDESDLVPPYAAALVESLRAVGYDLATALADLTDNSVSSKSRNIDIFFHWAAEQSAIAIADDGTGMTEDTLVDAMRVGSKNPREQRRKDDLGRFGLGLKTASFSQSRRVTVFTQQMPNQQFIRCWDLDFIADCNQWRLLREPSDLASRLARQLLKSSHGTVVVWERLDRLTNGTKIDDDNDENAFLRQAEHVGKHFSTVFHRLMAGPNKIQFSLNGIQIKPWDPFLSDETATQRLPIERLEWNGETIEIEPFVLPHASKIDPQTHRDAAGIRGWNAHQGFYVYRNYRLLVPGDWLGLKGWRQEEHYKLARIRLDFPNTLDQDWDIAFTKSKATPPERLRRELERIGERTRNVAKRVYTFRGAKLLPIAGQERTFLWEQTVKHSKVSYRLNRDHPLIRQAISSCHNSQILKSLFRLIEETIPIPLIMSTDREMPDTSTAPFESSKTSEIAEIMRQVFASLLSSGLSRPEALDRLGTIEPFGQFPELLQLLDEELI